MAQQTRTITDYVDDIEEKRFEQGEGESLTFSFDGKTYEIDLNTKNAGKMRKAFQFYVDHARPAAHVSPAAPFRSRGRGPNATGADRDYDLADLRAWAKREGIELPSRGRIKGSIIEQYKAAQK